MWRMDGGLAATLDVPSHLSPHHSGPAARARRVEIQPTFSRPDFLTSGCSRGQLQLACLGMLSRPARFHGQPQEGSSATQRRPQARVFSLQPPARRIRPVSYLHSHVHLHLQRRCRHSRHEGQFNRRHSATPAATGPAPLTGHRNCADRCYRIHLPGTYLAPTWQLRCRSSTRPRRRRPCCCCYNHGCHSRRTCSGARNPQRTYPLCSM